MIWEILGKGHKFRVFSVKGIQGVIISRNIANIKQKSNWEKLETRPELNLFQAKRHFECDDYF